jgi:hypothetical protein
MTKGDEMSAKRWNELTKEDIGLRSLKESEKLQRRADWRGIEVKDEDVPMVARRCSQTIDGGWATYSCSKEAVWALDSGRYGHVEYFCGGHASGRLRSVKTDARKAAEREEQESSEAVAKRKLTEAARALGIEDFDLDYRWSSSTYSKTHAVVSIADLERLADEHSDCVPLEQA